MIQLILLLHRCDNYLWYSHFNISMSVTDLVASSKEWRAGLAQTEQRAGLSVAHSIMTSSPTNAQNLRESKCLGSHVGHQEVGRGPIRGDSEEFVINRQ